MSSVQSRLRAAFVCGISAAICFAASPTPADEDDEQIESLEPGLAAAYRSLAPGSADTTLARIEARPSFALGSSSPHPRIPPGPFEVVWKGRLDQTVPDHVRFGAYVAGDVTVIVNGVTVLQGRGEAETAWVDAKPSLEIPFGSHTLVIVYRSLPEVPARLQLWWSGTSFSWEPLPAWRFKHAGVDVSDALRGDDLAARGRQIAGQLGCARCHRAALPSTDETPPGPALAGLERRVSRPWLLAWLADPAQIRSGAHMPVLFAKDRQGFVERSIVAEYLLGRGQSGQPASEMAGDVLAGRKQFLSLGCFACHGIPDKLHPTKAQPGQHRLEGLTDRMPQHELAAFLVNPHVRYPDGRMPLLPMDQKAAQDIAAFLLSSCEPAEPAAPGGDSITDAERHAVAKRLGVEGLEAVGRALVREKRCHQCHPGLEDKQSMPEAIAIRARSRDGEPTGCLSGSTLPRFQLAAPTRQALSAYLAVASQERHPSPFEARQQLLARSGCFQCHSRNVEALSPLEEIGSQIADKDLGKVPGQRTPRLAGVLSKYQRSHLTAAIRDGVKSPRYTYRMPAFGDKAQAIIQALAEADGELFDQPETAPPLVADPELSAQGPALVGTAGYSCVNCHLWKGKHLAAPEPGAAAPELTTVTHRIRRDYFDRWLDHPARVQPRTPMPQIFRKGQPALLASVLDGDPQRQKDALWSYFALGAEAAEPISLPPTPVPAPTAGQPPLVAQIPLHMSDGTVVESIVVLWSSHDALVYDVGTLTLREMFTGARLLRVPKDRRYFSLVGTSTSLDFTTAPPRLGSSDTSQKSVSIMLLGYDRLADGVRIRTRAQFDGNTVDVSETLRLEKTGERRLLRKLGSSTMAYSLPPAQEPAALKKAVPVNGPAVAHGTIDGLAEQPGYRAIAYPRFKTAYGEDLVMPGAMSVSPRDGRLYIASMKMGELFVLDDPNDDGTNARFANFGGGLFQDAYSMLHEGDALYLLHRRNLTRIHDLDGDGVADTFDRVAALKHTHVQNKDNAYGLVRDSGGGFVFTYGVNTPQKLPGWGSVLRLKPGEPGALEELAFGLRRCYGWSTGPEGEIFFTDNQGEWVATNRICHVQPGKTYGYRNPGQEHHLEKPFGKTAVWVPYGWALSTNGLVYDTTGGKFGPFAGQFFTAGWTDRGGIIRVQVEKVNGIYQGACYPFWGKGMLGPLVLAFDLKGRLFVGGITEGSCGAHPDRGGLFRIDFTGETPFEIESIHVRPRGFRLKFTQAVDPATARDTASYLVEHYRYAYSGEYGSPELDRTRVQPTRIELADDGRTVDLELPALVQDRVYMLHPEGVRSSQGEPLVHPVGAYTLNEIPVE